MFRLFLALYVFIGVGLHHTKSQEIAGSSSTVIDSSKYFTFHNNYWVNLHHYLYEKASKKQEKKLDEDGFKLKELDETRILSKLTDENKKHLDSAISFYKKKVIKRSMLASSGLLYALQDLGEVPIESSADLSEDLAYNLNAASKAYNNLWPLHRKQNESIVKQHIERIREHEEQVMNDMARYSGDPWVYTNVRIDISTYGDWAGAYSIAKPKPSIVISSLDPTASTTMFIESVYHEGSHIIYTRDSPFREKLYVRCKEIGQDFPRGLWHAAMFYLSGRLTQEALKSTGVDHELIMIAKDVFARYNTQEFQADLEAYISGQVDMDATVDALLANLRG